MSGKTHLKIVALQGFFFDIPDLQLPAPYTYELQQYERTSVDEVPERIRDADIVIMITIKLSAEVLAAEVCPNLKMIAIVASGTDSVDLAACKARGIHVANTPHCNTVSVTEHALSLYFAARRSITLSNYLTRAGEWSKRGTLIKSVDGPDGTAPITCGSETMGIIGYGSIGKRLEVTAKALGMKVLISGRKGSATVPEGRTPFDTVIRESSVVVLCLPRSPETLNTISEKELEAMPSHAVLVNVSRGGIVDEEALVAALKARKIAGAATDVYLTEPAGPENNVLLAPETAELNLVTTPHTAWCAWDTTANYGASLKKNLATWLEGNPTNTVV
ncbi:glycerate dehydrogenase [Xylariales sp. PMI_506]|nr:glycerate dehydrogenase [Xylariales sp. PMI_506]